MEEQRELKAMASGSVDAFERIFFQYQPKLIFFLTGLTHDGEVSRDMAQDIFLSLWKDRDKLSGVNSFSSYLYRIARNHVYNYYDHLSICDKYSTEQLTRSVEDYSIEETLFVKELQTQINHVVDQMPSQRQRIFKMSRVEGFTNDEIAVRLSISKRTVENHLTAALSDLRKVILFLCIFPSVY